MPFGSSNNTPNYPPGYTPPGSVQTTQPVEGTSQIPTIEDLYQTPPDTAVAEVPEGAQVEGALTQGAIASEVGTPGGATADLITGQTTVADTLHDITGADSPLMVQARQQGVLSAARRGLHGSSIAAGASQAEMVKAALPIAQQDAAAANRIAEINAQLGTDVSRFNAEQLNEAERLAAQMQTAVSQGNAADYNEAQRQAADLQVRADLEHLSQTFASSQQSAAATNAFASQVMALNTELNKQYLAGTQAIDLAQIQGQYNQIISQNESAARLYDSFFTGISSMMAEPDISPERVAQQVQVQLQQLQGALSYIQELNNIDLPDFTPPGTPVSTPTPTPQPGGPTIPQIPPTEGGGGGDPAQEFLDQIGGTEGGGGGGDAAQQFLNQI